LQIEQTFLTSCTKGNTAERLDWRDVLKPELFRHLQVVRLEFRLRAEESVALPSFLGSTLRGAFGHALKLSACHSNGTPCQSCQLPLDCWYGWLFETVSPAGGEVLAKNQDAPRPFIITPPLDGQLGPERRLRRGEKITFSMTLLGGAVNGLPYAVYGIEEMARSGLGVKRGLFSLSDVFSLNHDGERTSLDYDPSTKRLNLMKTEVCTVEDLIVKRLSELPTTLDRLKLSFLTRARIRVEDRLQDSIDFASMIRFLWRRTSLLLEIHGSGYPTLDRNGMMATADTVHNIAAATIRHEVWRSSNRQGRRLHQDGFLGEIVFEGAALKGFLPLLLAGETLHVGSGATFGLGKYQISSWY
jgi:hypothetical protein